MRKAILASTMLLGFGAGLALAQPMPLAQPGISEAAPPAPGGEPVPLSVGSCPPGGGATTPFPNGPPPLTDSGPGAFDDHAPDYNHCRCWASGEYVHWWLHKYEPPLITTSTVSGNPGILGQPGTEVLYGKETDSEEHSGGRFTVGTWCGNSPFALEAGFLFLGERSLDFNASSDATGAPPLARPVVNSRTGHETVESITAPAEFAGYVTASSKTEMWSAEVNAILELHCMSYFKYPDLVIGIRYIDLKDSLFIDQNSTALSGGIIGFQGTEFGTLAVANVYDRFATRNQFYGGQIGMRGGMDWGRLYLDGMVNVALGNNHQTADITGGTHLSGILRTSPPLPFDQTVPGGLLALSSNIGHAHNDEFSIIPEVGLNFGVHLFKWCDAYVGYSFMYWNNVVRPGNEIDRAVNPTLLPTSVQSVTPAGVGRPAFAFNNTDFWAHGINVGMAFRF